MVKEKLDSRSKILQRILISFVVIGALSSGLRLILSFLGMGSLPTVMNTVPVTTQTIYTLPLPADFIFSASPYTLVIGGFSAFLYVYIFRDKETQGVFIGWGILLVLHLIATWYFAWL